MKRVTGRNDDMLIIRGVNVYPSQVEAALIAMPETAPHYQLEIAREGMLDTLKVKVERTEQAGNDLPGKEKLEARIRERLKSALGVNASVELVEPHTIERSEGKAKRVIDLRQEAIA
jgi:phenylacetate-CoA ligase